jgi:putative ABC transport system ATP-binding protein
MDKSLFRYIWRHSSRDQLIIFLVVLASLPFYFASLDLPKRIVNEAIQGRPFADGRTTARFLDIVLPLPDARGGPIRLFAGFEVDRLTLLFGLSGLFLFFVLVNGAFKYWINVAKGALGERMLRRLRFDLFSLLLRFTPETLRTVKSSEAATIIKDEVEPIGTFIGDAFVLPVFLGTQAATALLFIFIQNVWLGVLAAAVVSAQMIVIPRLRRQLLRLSRQRQVASRRLAGRVSEVVDGIEAVHIHGTSSWERAEIGHRLYELFDLRFQIYKRKFMVKFLNNLLAQMTPFFFYVVGGYFALRGRLDIGQLVAVIGAYRELPPPLKELIDWDQQRLDVQVKYDQVVQYFATDKLLPGEESDQEVGHDAPLVGLLGVESLRVLDPQGAPIIDQTSFACALPARVALVGDGGPAAGVLARILARRRGGYEGVVTIGGRNLADLPRAVVGRRIAYAGVEPVLFPGTLRDNLVYGLRRRPPHSPDEHGREAMRRLAEARRTGNPVESIEGPWVDLARAGARDRDDLDRILLGWIKRMGLEDDVYRFGLSGKVDPERHPALAQHVVEARRRLRDKLEAERMADLVEPFDEARYSRQATVAENLLFGAPTSRALMGRDLAEHRPFRQALEREGLTRPLVGMGARIAETMIEIFRDVPPGHPLFEQFSFIGADELPDYQAILSRRAGRARGEPGGRFALVPLPLATTRLIALSLGYIEPRHRLGLLDEPLMQRIVAARASVRALLVRSHHPGVAFYDPGRVCAAAPLRDNLLFGRVNQSVADAQTRVAAAIAAVVDELGMRDEIDGLGLDHQVGPAGRLLTAQQRASVNLIRCLVKRPDVLVIDGALAPFGEAGARSLLTLVLTPSEDRSVFVTLPDDREAGRFDALIRFQGTGAVLEDQQQPRAVGAEAAE